MLIKEHLTRRLDKIDNGAIQKTRFLKHSLSALMEWLEIIHKAQTIKLPDEGFGVLFKKVELPSQNTTFHCCLNNDGLKFFEYIMLPLLR